MKRESSKIQTKNTALFFHEVSAIPFKIRNEYLGKLTKRLRSERQKNVRLLKIIYRVIENDGISLWNPEEVCKALSISMNQLYWHKHKILKGLRELYFGWEKIEQKINREIQKEIKEDISASASKGRDKNDSDIQYLLIKAKRIYETGMRKEAKNIFLNLSNVFEKKQDKKHLPEDELLHLSEIYEHILQYYYEQRNLVRYGLFLRKLQGLMHNTEGKGFKLTKEQESMLKIRFYYAKAYKHKFHNYNNTSVYKVKEYLERALYEARSIDSTHYKVFIGYKIYLIDDVLGEKNIKAILREGSRLSKENGYRLEHVAYKSSLTFQEFKNAETKDVKYLKKLKKYFKVSGEINPVNQYSIYCTENYLKALLHFKPHKFEEELKKLVKRQVLFSQTAIARWNLYQLKPGVEIFYSHRIIKDNVSGKHFITIGEVYYDRVKKLEELANETLARLNNVHSVNFRIQILTDLLESEFWKGKNCDFEKALSVIKRIEWIWRTKKVSQNKLGFHLMKLGIRMMYESIFHRKNEVLDKHLQNFINISNSLLKKTGNNVLVCYFLTALITQQLGYKEIWDIVKGHYIWMEKNHPKLMAQLKKYVMDSKTKEKTNRDSSKAA